MAGRRGGEATGAKVDPLMRVPPVAKSAIAFPAGKDSVLLPIPVAVVVNPAAMAGFTAATEPFGMMPAFIAEATQLLVMEAPSQLPVLPATVTVGPELTAMETTFAGGYVNVQLMADDPLPVRVRFNVALPFAAAVADDNANLSRPKRDVPNMTGSVTTKIPRTSRFSVCPRLSLYMAYLPDQRHSGDFPMPADRIHILRLKMKLVINDLVLLNCVSAIQKITKSGSCKH